MRNFFKHNLPLIIIIILSIVFLPTVFSKDAESESDAIVTAIGVDKQQDEFQLSLQIVVPTPSSQYKQKLSLVTETGKDISSTMSKISLRLGKNIGLAHCRVFVFSDEVAQEGLTQIFDYIFRSKSNTQNIVIINTPDSSKEFLSNAADLENNLYFSIRNKGSFNENYLYGNQTTLGTYYNDYLGPVKVSIISIVELLDESEASGDTSGSGSSSSSSGDTASGSGSSSSSTSGGSNSSGADSANESASGSQSSGSSGQQSSSSQSQQKKVIVNRGKILVTKEGKKALVLSSEQGLVINWFRKESNSGVIVIENVFEEGLFDNANIGIEVDRKTSNISTYFKDDKPIYKLNIEMFVRTIEINQNGYTSKNYKSNNINITPHLKELIKQKIEEQTKEGFKLCQDNNLDMIQVYENFYKYNNKKFKKYLNSIENKEEYLKGIEFEVDVKVIEHL